MLRMETPIGIMMAKKYLDQDYPAMEIYVGEHLVAVVEGVVKEELVSVRVYLKNHEEPVHIDWSNEKIRLPRDFKSNGLDPKGSGLRLFESNRKERLAKGLRDMLSGSDVHEGDWSDGFTDEDAEDVLSIVNYFLRLNNFRGQIIMIWDRYEDGPSPFFGGDSNLYYQISLSGEKLWYPVTIPLSEEGNIERFFDDLLAIEDGKAVVKAEQFYPKHIHPWKYNAALRVLKFPTA